MFQPKIPEISFEDFIKGTDLPNNLKIQQTGKNYSGEQFIITINKLPDSQTALTIDPSKDPYTSVKFDENDDFKCGFTFDGTRYLSFTNLNLSDCTISFLNRAEITFTLCTFKNCIIEANDHAAIRINGAKIENTHFKSTFSTFYLNDNIFLDSNLEFEHSSLIASFTDVFQNTKINVSIFSDFQAERSLFVFQKENENSVFESFICQKEATFSLLNCNISGPGNKFIFDETVLDKVSSIKHCNFNDSQLYFNKLSNLFITETTLTNTTAFIEEPEKLHIEKSVVFSSSFTLKNSKYVDFFETTFKSCVTAIECLKTSFGLHNCRFYSCATPISLSESHLNIIGSNFVSSLANSIFVTNHSQLQMMYCVFLTPHFYDISIESESFAKITACMFVDPYEPLSDQIQSIYVNDSALLIQASFFKTNVLVDDIEKMSWKSLHPSKFSSTSQNKPLLAIICETNKYPVVIQSCECNEIRYDWSNGPITTLPYFHDSQLPPL